MGGERAPEGAAPWSPVALTALGAIVAQQLLVLGAVRFVLYPELIVYPYLTASGWLPYREILDQHFPGLLFLPVNFHTLGLRDPWDFHLLLMAVAASQTVLTYVVARRLAGEAPALLAALAYAAWQPFFEGETLWLDTLLPLFTLPALLLLLDARWFVAGLALGIGVLFKQTLVPLVAFAGLVVLRECGLHGWRSVLRFAAGALLPSLATLAYLAKIGVLADFWFWTVTFNLSTYATDGTLAPRLGDVVRMALPVAIGIASLVVAPARWRAPLVALWGILSIAGGVGRFGLVHLQPAVPCFAILLGMLGVELWQRRATIALLVLVAITPVWLGEFYGRRARWLDDAAAKARLAAVEQLIRDRAAPSERVLLLGVSPQLYAATGTLPPGRVFVFPFPWFLDVAGDRVLESLRRDPPKLVLIDTGSATDGRLLRDDARPILDEVRARWAPTARVGTVEVYEPRSE